MGRHGPELAILTTANVVRPCAKSEKPPGKARKSSLPSTLPPGFPETVTTVGREPETACEASLFDGERSVHCVTGPPDGVSPVVASNQSKRPLVGIAGAPADPPLPALPPIAPPPAPPPVPPFASPPAPALPATPPVAPPSAPAPATPPVEPPLPPLDASGLPPPAPEPAAPPTR